MIIIGDLQIMAQRYDELNEAQKDIKTDEVIVQDSEDNFWIVDSENYEKLEAYGYKKIEEK